MGGPEHELAADTLKGALLGDVMQHHHCAENRTFGLADRRQAIGQQAVFTFNVYAQVFRQAFQTAAVQNRQQLLIELRARQGFAQWLPQTTFIPAQLPLRDGV